MTGTSPKPAASAPKIPLFTQEDVLTILEGYRGETEGCGCCRNDDANNDRLREIVAKALLARDPRPRWDVAVAKALALMRSVAPFQYDEVFEPAPED